MPMFVETNFHSLIRWSDWCFFVVPIKKFMLLKHKTSTLRMFLHGCTNQIVKKSTAHLNKTQFKKKKCTYVNIDP